MSKKPSTKGWWDNMPTVTTGSRQIWITDVPAEGRMALVQKGYRPVDVRTLPRDTDMEHAIAIESWLQGMAEGTIPADPERRKTLELEARLHGLLVNRSLRIEGSVKVDKQTIEKLMEIGESKFTLKGSSEAQIQRAKEVALIPGAKLLDEDN